MAALGWLHEGISEELGWLGRNISFHAIRMVKSIVFWREKASYLTGVWRG